MTEQSIVKKKKPVRIEDEPRIAVTEKLLWNMSDLIQITGLSRNSLTRMRDRGELPKPVDLGLTRVFWSADVIRRWVVARSS